MVTVMMMIAMVMMIKMVMILIRRQKITICMCRGNICRIHSNLLTNYCYHITIEDEDIYLSWPVTPPLHDAIHASA